MEFPKTLNSIQEFATSLIVSRTRMKKKIEDHIFLLLLLLFKCVHNFKILNETSVRDKIQTCKLRIWSETPYPSGHAGTFTFFAVALLYKKVWKQKLWKELDWSELLFCLLCMTIDYLLKGYRPWGGGTLRRGNSKDWRTCLILFLLFFNIHKKKYWNREFYNFLFFLCP